MFEIDLLNGEGRPVKSQPWAIALVTAPLIIPLAAIAFLIGSYVTAGIEIRSLNNRAASIDTRLADMTDAKRQRNTAQAQILSAAKSSGEIAELIKGQMQWSDVISEISNLVPGSVVLNRITASRERILLRPDDSGAPRTEYKFTIMMGAYDTSGKSGDAVRHFIDSLQSSAVLGPRIESIKLVSHQSGTYNDREVAAYEIACVLRGVQ